MKIRQATVEDSASIAKVQVDSYLTSYVDIFPSMYLEHFTYGEQEQDWRDWFSSNDHSLYVAVTNKSEVVGYALGQPNSDEVMPYECELVALHVRKEHQRQGLGSRLFAAVSKNLSTQDYQSLFLWVLADNSARNLYEKRGGKVVESRPWQNNHYFGTNISEVAYGWLDIRNIFDYDQD